MSRQTELYSFYERLQIRLARKQAHTPSRQLKSLESNTEAQKRYDGIPVCRLNFADSSPIEFLTNLR